MKLLSWYVRKSKYHNNYQEEMKRYNLAGEECGVVTAKDANYTSFKTANWLKKKEDIQKERQ